MELRSGFEISLLLPQRTAARVSLTFSFPNFNTNKVSFIPLIRPILFARARAIIIRKTSRRLAAPLCPTLCVYKITNVNGRMNGLDFKSLFSQDRIISQLRWEIHNEGRVREIHSPRYTKKRLEKILHERGGEKRGRERETSPVAKLLNEFPGNAIFPQRRGGGARDVK